MASSSLRACGYLLSHSLHTLTPTAHRLHLVPLCLCYRLPPSPRPAPPALAPATSGFSTWISCGRGSLA